MEEEEKEEGKKERKRRQKKGNQSSGIDWKPSFHLLFIGGETRATTDTLTRPGPFAEMETPRQSHKNTLRGAMGVCTTGPS